MDIEVKQALATLTEQLIKATEAAYRAEERASGALAFISKRHPQVAQEYEEFVRGNTAVADERDRQLGGLHALLRSL